MSDTLSVQLWDRLMCALEEDIERAPDADLLGWPNALELATVLRQRVDAALQDAADAHRVLASRIPGDARARRDLLRRVMARRPTAPMVSSVAFGAPEALSDSEVEGILRDLLRAGELDEQDKPR